MKTAVILISVIYVSVINARYRVRHGSVALSDVPVYHESVALRDVPDYRWMRKPTRDFRPYDLPEYRLMRKPSRDFQPYDFPTVQRQYAYAPFQRKFLRAQEGPSEEEKFLGYAMNFISFSGGDLNKVNFINIDTKLAYLDGIGANEMKLSADEAKKIADVYKDLNFDPFRRDGLTIDGALYYYASLTDGKKLLMESMEGKKIVMSKADKTVMIGRVTPGKSSYNAKNALNSMGKYLSDDGY